MSVEYSITYTVDVSGAIAGIDQLSAHLRALITLADQSKVKCAAVGQGMAAPLNTAATAAGKLGVSLGTLTTQANSAATATTNAGRATQGFGVSAQGATQGTEGASTALTGYLGKMLALQAARAIFSEIMEQTKELQAYWEKIAKDTTDFRRELREQASLTGETGPNNRVIAATLDLALAARVDKDVASQFITEYENIGPTVREREHYKPDKGTPEELEKGVITEAAKTAERLGINPKDAAAAIGQAGLMHTFTSVEQAMEQFGGAVEGIQLGKLSYSQGVKYLSAASAALQDPNAAAGENAVPGTTGTFAETGVYLGASSLGTTSAAKASQQMIQVSRLLNPAEGYHGGLPFQSLQNAGVGRDSGLKDQDKLIQLNKYLDNLGVTDKKAWLEQQGLGSDAQRTTTNKMFNVADVLESRLKKARESEATSAMGKATMGLNADFMKSDLASQAAGIESAGQATDTTLGVNVSEQLSQARKAADVRQKQHDKTYFSLVYRTLRSFSGAVYGPGSGVSGEEGFQEFSETPGAEGAIPFLKKEAERVGVDISEEAPDLAQFTDVQTRGRAFKKAAEKVRAKGGDPYGLGGIEAQAKKGVNALRGPKDAALRPGAPLADDANAPPGIGPQAGLGGAGGGVDALVPILQAQLTEARETNRKLTPGPMANGYSVAALGPLPSDGGDFGGRRS